MAARSRAAGTATSHLSAEELARLRELLLEEREQQLARSRELDGAADMEADLADVLAVRAQEALEETEQALALLDEGNYGACASCGDPIPFERLEAIPGARSCVSCQAGRERNGR